MLATVADYRRITGDNTSDVATITDALVEGQNLVEEALNRQGLMESAVRTETVRVYNLVGGIYFIQGLAYPKATPITAVSSPGGVTFSGSEITGITGTSFDLVNDLISEFPLTPVTYTGGYTSLTVPSTIRRAICRCAQIVVAQPQPVLSGAASVRVGDVSITYTHNPSPDAALTGILADGALMSYRRRRPLR